MVLWKKYKKFIDNLNSNNFYLVEPILNSKSSYHILAIIFNDLKMSDNFQKIYEKNNIAATVHYIPLHKSKKWVKSYVIINCPLLKIFI